MQLSLHAQYILERTDKSVIETDKGFIIYSFTDPTTVYIEDIYTLPEYRKSHIATELANQVINIAKAKGCTKALGSVCPSAKNSTASLSVLIAYGMTLDSCHNNFILFKKDIS